MITKCQALIFDVDGTLPKTDDLHRKAFNQTFQKWYLGWHWDFKIYKQLLKVSGAKEKFNYYKPFSLKQIRMILCEKYSKNLSIKRV